MKDPQPQQIMVAALDAAPTLLENLFWGALLGWSSWDLYFCELSITCLGGPGYVPDDFQGEA